MFEVGQAFVGARSDGSHGGDNKYANPRTHAWIVSGRATKPNNVVRWKAYKPSRILADYHVLLAIT